MAPCEAGLAAGPGCTPPDRVNPGPASGYKPRNVSRPNEETPLKDADAYATRAYDWLCKDDFARSLKDYDLAIQLEPDRADFWNARGFTWHMKSIQDKDRPSCEDRALSDYAE